MYAIKDENGKLLKETIGSGTSEAISKWEKLTGKQWGNNIAMELQVVPVHQLRDYPYFDQREHFILPLQDGQDLDIGIGYYINSLKYGWPVEDHCVESITMVGNSHKYKPN